MRANLKSDKGTDVGRHVQHRHEVKEANPQLKMVDIAKKLGEMWRGMGVDVRRNGRTRQHKPRIVIWRTRRRGWSNDKLCRQHHMANNLLCVIFDVVRARNVGLLVLICWASAMEFQGKI